jgi:hypothetical protein
MSKREAISIYKDHGSIRTINEFDVKSSHS